MTMKKTQERKHNRDSATTEKQGVWHLGKDYCVRTVTMIQVGKLIEVTDHELVLKDAAWIADTGRWADFLSYGKANEVEPFPDGNIIVGRHAIIDACIWKHGRLRSQK